MTAGDGPAPPGGPQRVLARRNPAAGQRAGRGSRQPRRNPAGRGGHRRARRAPRAFRPEAGRIRRSSCWPRSAAMWTRRGEAAVGLRARAAAIAAGAAAGATTDERDPAARPGSRPRAPRPEYGSRRGAKRSDRRWRPGGAGLQSATTSAAAARRQAAAPGAPGAGAGAGHRTGRGGRGARDRRGGQPAVAGRGRARGPAPLSRCSPARGAARRSGECGRHAEPPGRCGSAPGHGPERRAPGPPGCTASCRGGLQVPGPAARAQRRAYRAWSLPQPVAGAVLALGRGPGLRLVTERVLSRSQGQVLGARAGHPECDSRRGAASSTAPSGRTGSRAGPGARSGSGTGGKARARAAAGHGGPVSKPPQLTSSRAGAVPRASPGSVLAAAGRPAVSHQHRNGPGRRARLAGTRRRPSPGSSGCASPWVRQQRGAARGPDAPAPARRRCRVGRPRGKVTGTGRREVTGRWGR